MLLKNRQKNAPDSDEKFFDELVYLRQEVKRLRAALSRLTPGLETVLKRRGFIIYKKEPSEALLIPSRRHLTAYYEMMHKYSFRLFLRDVIKHQKSFTIEQVTRYATEEVTRGYVDHLVSMKLIRKKKAGYELIKGPIRSFGETLEWYISELLYREFGMEAIWGVKFKRPKVGGDYDVIAKFEGVVLYMEVKSSPPKQIYDSEISAFLDRVGDLSPALAIFLMDTELRMKDKIVPMFERQLAERYKDPPGVSRLERELFQVEGPIFIINAKEDIRQNIRKVLFAYYRRERDEIPVGKINPLKAADNR